MTLSDLLEHEVARSRARVPLPAVHAVYSRGLTAAGDASDADARALERVRSFLTAAASCSPDLTRDTDLLPHRASPTKLQSTYALAEEHSDRKVADLLLSCAVIEPGTPQHVFTLGRALKAATRHGDPRVREGLTAAVRALLADGNSGLARSLRARRQLRDRKGRWIEMGGGVRFKVRAPGSPGGGQWFHGRVEGMDVPNGRVNVRLDDGRLVAVPNDKLEQPAAILNLPGQPLEPATDPADFDADAPEVARLDDVPEGANLNRFAGAVPGPDELRRAVRDATGEFLNRIPGNSTERDTAVRASRALISAVDNAARLGGEGAANIRDLASNGALFANARATRTRGVEATQWRALAEDLEDIAAAASGDGQNDGQTWTNDPRTGDRVRVDGKIGTQIGPDGRPTGSRPPVAPGQAPDRREQDGAIRRAAALLRQGGADENAIPGYLQNIGMRYGDPRDADRPEPDRMTINTNNGPIELPGLTRADAIAINRAQIESAQNAPLRPGGGIGWRGEDRARAWNERVRNALGMSPESSPVQRIPEMPGDVTPDSVRNIPESPDTPASEADGQRFELRFNFDEITDSIQDNSEFWDGIRQHNLDIIDEDPENGVILQGSRDDLESFYNEFGRGRLAPDRLEPAPDDGTPPAPAPFDVPSRAETPALAPETPDTPDTSGGNPESDAADRLEELAGEFSGIEDEEIGNIERTLNQIAGDLRNGNYEPAAAADDIDAVINAVEDHFRDEGVPFSLQGAMDDLNTTMRELRLGRRNPAPAAPEPTPESEAETPDVSEPSTGDRFEMRFDFEDLADDLQANDMYSAIQRHNLEVVEEDPQAGVFLQGSRENLQAFWNEVGRDVIPPDRIQPAPQTPNDASVSPEDNSADVEAAAGVVRNAIDALPNEIFDGFQDLRDLIDGPLDEQHVEVAAGEANAFELLARGERADGGDPAPYERARDALFGLADALNPGGPVDRQQGINDLPEPASEPGPPEPPVDPEVRDHLGGDVPVGFSFDRELSPNGFGTVQRYTHQGEDGENYQIDVGGTPDNPHYVIRRGAQGELVTDVPDWNDVLDHFLNQPESTPSEPSDVSVPEEGAPARLSREEVMDRVRRNVDDQGRPVPEGWRRDATGEQLDTIFRGPANYVAIPDVDQFVLMRRENGQFVQVGEGAHGDWDSVIAAVEQDRQARAADHREELAGLLEQAGFSPADIDAARLVQSADDLRAEIQASPRWRALSRPGNEAEFFPVRNALNDALDLPTDGNQEGENTPQANRRRLISALERAIPGLSNDTVRQVSEAQDAEDVQRALEADPAFSDYARRMFDLRDQDLPQARDRALLDNWRAINDQIRGVGDLPADSTPESQGGPEQPVSPETPPAPEAPAVAEPGAPEAPAEPAGEIRQGVPRPPGAPPERRRLHDRNGVITDYRGQPLYRGLIVEALAGRGGVYGEVVRVQEDTGYAEVRFPDGRVLGRSRTRLRVLSDAEAQAHRAGAGQPVNVVNVPPAPAAPDAPAAPNRPFALQPEAAQRGVQEILDMHQAGAARGWGVVPEVMRARDGLNRALQAVRRNGNVDDLREALQEAVDNYDRALGGNRIDNGSDYWRDVAVRRQRTAGLLNRLGGRAPVAPPGAPEADPEAPAAPQVDVPRIRGQLAAIRDSIPRAQRQAGGAARWRAGFALDDALQNLDAGRLDLAVQDLERVRDRLRAAGDVANGDEVRRFQEQLQAAQGAPAAPEAPAVPRGEGFQPGDFIAPRVENPRQAAPVGQSGAAPGIQDPRFGQPAPDYALNSNAQQTDFAAWGPRAAEIAEAARTRPSMESMFALRTSDQLNIAVREAFGSDNVGVKFGGNNYTLHFQRASNTGSEISVSFVIKDANGQQVGTTQRTIKKAANGKIGVYNAYMQLNSNAQGGGFASAYNRYMENWYIANGVDNVTVSAGLDKGGFVWALNGFGWKTDPRGSSQRMLQRIEREARTDAERQQVAALKARLNNGDYPTPMELALIGWNPRLGKDQSWAGKRGMLGTGWGGIKKLRPTDKNMVQRQNYDIATRARARVAAGENAPQVSDQLIERFSNGGVSGAAEVGLGQRDLAQIGDVLRQRQSLASVPFRQKRALQQLTNDRLRAGDPNAQDMLLLRTALNHELAADYPDPADLGVGEALRDVRFQDIVDNDVPGFTVSRPDNGMGMNDTYKVTHDASGQVFFFKRERAGNGDIEHDVVHMLRNSGYRGYGAYATSNLRAPTREVLASELQTAADALPEGATRRRITESINALNQGASVNYYSVATTLRTGALNEPGVTDEARRVVMNLADRMDNRGVVIQQRAGDSLDLPKRPNDAKKHNSAEYLNGTYANYDDPLRMILLDAVIGNTDRHTGNFQLAKDSNSRWWIFPIDHGLANIGKNRQYSASQSLGSRSGFNSKLARIMGERGRSRELLRADILRIVGEYRAALQAGGYADPNFVQRAQAQLDDLENNIATVVANIARGNGGFW